MKIYKPSSKCFPTLVIIGLTIFGGAKIVWSQTFTDNTFNNADWSALRLPISVNGSSFTAAQDTSVGNPASSRLTTHTYPMGQIYVAHTYQGAGSQYNLAQGAIVTLSYSYDVSRTTTGSVAYSPLIVQNGTYYWLASNNLISSSNWTTFSSANLTAASFAKLWGPSAAAHPDFSCNGATLTFGYVTRNNNTIAGQTDTTKSRIDNWRISITSTTQCCVARPAGMVGWWQFEEQNGATVVNDIAGFNNQGMPKPAPALGPMHAPNSVPGQVNNALHFYGPYLEVVPHPTLDFGTGSFSIDAWVKPFDCSHGGPGDLSPIVDKSLPPFKGFRFYLDQPSSGVARIYFRINNATFSSSGTISTLNSATWSHIAVTVSRPSIGASLGRFYINGAILGNFTPPAGNVNVPIPLWIGKLRIPGGPCEIDIDELELFNRALTPGEVQSIARAGHFGKCP